MIVREASLSDISKITEVYVDSWKTTYKGILTEEYLNNISYKEKEEYLLNYFRKPKSKFFVSVNDKGEVTGFVAFGEESTGKTKYRGELYFIYLLKEYKGQGIGKLLINKAIEELEKANITSMLIWALEKNSTCKFYEYLGGKKTFERYSVYNGENFKDVAYTWDDIKSIKKLSSIGRQ